MQVSRPIGPVSPALAAKSRWRGRGGRASGPRLAAELLDGFFGDRREEVDEVAVGVAEQDGAVAPGHRGGLLNPVVDQRREPLVFAVDVLDAELDDRSEEHTSELQ